MFPAECSLHVKTYIVKGGIETKIAAEVNLMFIVLSVFVTNTTLNAY